MIVVGIVKRKVDFLLVLKKRIIFLMVCRVRLENLK